MIAWFGGVYLTGTIYSERAGGVVIDGQPQTQIVLPLRAERARPLARKNKLLRITIPLWREFSSELESLEAMAKDFLDLPHEGALMLMEEKGTSMRILTFAHAVLENHGQPQRVGVALRRQLVFVTGSYPASSTITLSAPGATPVIWNTITTNWESLTTNWESLA